MRKTRAMIEPRPPTAEFRLPWDDPAAPPPVEALTQARAAFGDSFVVESGGSEYWFVFAREALEAFYAIDEQVASKGLADFQMLRRRLPDELFLGRRTYAHDLFGAAEVTGYLGNVDWAIARSVAVLDPAEPLDVFAFARGVGHSIGLACWFGRDAPIDTLVGLLDRLDGAEAFVHPEQLAAHTFDDDRAVLADLVGVVAGLLARTDRQASFLDEVATRWADVTDDDERVSGIAYDLVLLHIATMTNLFAAIGWTLALTTLHGTHDADLEDATYESLRLGQRSIMLRAALRPFEFDDGIAVRTLTPGTFLATMLPLTNLTGGRFDPSRWRASGAHRDVSVTTFGHGSHRCPAQRFSMQAITRTVRAVRAAFELQALFDGVIPLPMQIGGVARNAAPALIHLTRR